jgi:hypothetical protein
MSMPTIWPFSSRSMTTPSCTSSESTLVRALMLVSDVSHLAEHEPRIKFHAVFFQQGDEFRLEIHPAMMRFLRIDVPNDRGNPRGAHAERRIPLLPAQFTAFLVRPPRRIRFDRQHRLRQRQLRRDLNWAYVWDMCRTYGAWRFCVSRSPRFRTGLTSDAPPVLRNKTDA